MDAILLRSRGRPRPERSKSLPARGTAASYSGPAAIDSEQPRKNNEFRKNGSLEDPFNWSQLPPDEEGAELSKDARIWKVYVGETDKWDAEMVDGWNKSLDVLLVFAALFSAISTTFLIESSGMLKQDPNDVSAAALASISQLLVAITTNSSSDPTTTTTDESNSVDKEFVPSWVAVVVNTLWFLSLALSISASFLAMLAKDWCHSFIAHRTGHHRDQAHRRQRKWTMIKGWKMEELILVLPSLIHLSLGKAIHTHLPQLSTESQVACQRFLQLGYVSTCGTSTRQ
ncbi:unnamed protein product [Rhizoctonia solani]|uniref:DUF6535 domain-containing protein n=1 Tax=Rhizoctonia solani TaxID=456999 RepID=A0A8H3DYD3_9AGAM|nr:unnamed protein product [Rhizoctonia solani]